MGLELFCGCLHGVYFVIWLLVITYVSNTVPEVDPLALTVDKKELLSPLSSGDIWNQFWIRMGKMNLLSCDLFQTVITWIPLCLQWLSIKLLNWFIMDVKMSMAFKRILWTWSPRNLFQLPGGWSPLCLQWCPLATVNADSNLSTLRQNTTVFMEWKLSGNSFSLESPSSVSTPHCPMLEI